MAKNAILSQYLASLCAVNGSTAKCNTYSCDGPWQVATLVAATAELLFQLFCPTESSEFEIAADLSSQTIRPHTSGYRLKGWRVNSD